MPRKTPAVPQSAVCDTARSRTVTPSRSYRTFQPALLPHEETLVMWWRSGNRFDTFDQWMNVSHRCSGASSAASDFLHGVLAAADFSIASALAIERATLSTVTPAPADVSQERDPKTIDMFSPRGRG